MNTIALSSRIVGPILLLLLIAPALGLAQTNESSGEYGSVIPEVSTVRNTSALLIAGEGGWIFDHTYAIGIGGAMLMNNIDARIPDTSGNHFLTLNYGGLTVGYIIPVDELYSVTVQALVGGGSISHEEIPYLDRRQYHDPFFVFEPSVTAEVSVSKIFKIGIGVSYRQAAWLKSNLATSSDLSGVSGHLSFKVGFF